MEGRDLKKNSSEKDSIKHVYFDGENKGEGEAKGNSPGKREFCE